MNPRALLAVTAAALLLTSCSTDKVKKAVTPEEDPISLSASVKDGAKGVTVDTIVTADAEHGSITEASLVAADGKSKINGRVTGSQWVASERLEPATKYKLTVKGTGDDKEADTLERTFTTHALTLQQQTYPSVAPLKGETVGVGMPVIVTFDIPVKNKDLFERNMDITTDQDVEGSWSWISDTVAHYRPKDFWPAGTNVKVNLRLNGLPAGNGIYGQQDQKVPFKIGRKVVSTVDIAAHRLVVRIDDEVVRTIPVSTGEYTAFMFKQNAIMWNELPVNTEGGPLEFDRKPRQGHGGGVTEMVSRRHVVPHSPGFRWLDASTAGEFATDAELALAANWDRTATSVKNTRFIALKTTEA